MMSLIPLIRSPFASGCPARVPDPDVHPAVSALSASSPFRPARPHRTRRTRDVPCVLRVRSCRVIRVTPDATTEPAGLRPAIGRSAEDAATPARQGGRGKRQTGGAAGALRGGTNEGAASVRSRRATERWYANL